MMNLMNAVVADVPEFWDSVYFGGSRHLPPPHRGLPK
jgi:hypothetical protein